MKRDTERSGESASAALDEASVINFSVTESQLTHHCVYDRSANNHAPLHFSTSWAEPKEFTCLLHDQVHLLLSVLGLSTWQPALLPVRVICAR